MRSLMQLAEEASSTPLSEKDLDWLHLLRADWQVLADLAAADLVLWLPADDGRFIAAAHCRPATSSTVHVDDIIGLHLPAAREVDLHRASHTAQTCHPAVAAAAVAKYSLGMNPAKMGMPTMDRAPMVNSTPAAGARWAAPRRERKS